VDVYTHHEATPIHPLDRYNGEYWEDARGIQMVKHLMPQWDYNYDESRRRLLRTTAATGAVLLAGCLGIGPNLRVENDTETTHRIEVHIQGESGEEIFESTYELAGGEQATEDDVYETEGTYTITATVDGDPTREEVTISKPDGVITRVEVRSETEVDIGRVVP
jgi:hypothetical protein